MDWRSCCGSHKKTEKKIKTAGDAFGVPAVFL